MSYIHIFEYFSNGNCRKLGILIEEMLKTKEGKNTLNNYLIWQVLAKSYFVD